jgi:hypothetical protein
MIPENDDQTVTLIGCALLATILATASTPGFAQQPAQQQPAFQPPTATELSALRDRLERLSTCAQLAKKIWDTRGGHSADWGDPTVDMRYDPTTDHCYVEMVMVSPPNLWTLERVPNDQHRVTIDLQNGGGQILELSKTATVYTTLWDGQTQELLATTTISGQGRFGTVFANDPNYKHTLPSADNGYGFDDADDYITRLMYGKH